MAVVAGKQALVAVLLAAHEAELDVEALCDAAKGLLFDSEKPCRWASAASVTVSQAAIDEAKGIALHNA
ncbi:hypothetical protein ACTSKR_07785 [Chitinibacteraceae bacterium HSL-7]